MLQTIPEIFIVGSILLLSIVFLYWIGTRAKKASIRLEQETLKLPLTNPEKIEESHKSKVLQMKRTWQKTTLVSGFSIISESWMFWILMGNSTLIIEDFNPTMFFGLYVLFLLYLTAGFGIGIVQIVRKRSFWNGQINPVRGIEINLEGFVQKKLKERPAELYEPKFYPEVEQNIRSNWELAFQSALNQAVMNEIYSRELSSDDRQLLLEHLARRDDMIGQTAIEIQKDFAMREIVDH